MPAPLRFDAVVIGAGVVGLAVARALALVGREVVVLEATAAIGSETSARSSEVIHAGLYYPTGSWKARLCVEGKQRLYAYCAARNVPHRRLGKLLLASNDEQRATLARYLAQARANGVDDLIELSPAEVAALEPAVRCAAALLSPSTGIVDSHAFLQALRADLEQAGGRVALASPLRAADVQGSGFRLAVGGAAPAEVTCRQLVNSAGLAAQAVAGTIAGLPPASIPALHLSKGSYFVLRGSSPFARLVYPLPEPGGLGVHVTLDLAGRARFGPDVEPVTRVDYRLDEGRAAAFYPAIRRYFPGLRDGDLLPGYAGIRPRLAPAMEPAPDFVIQGPEAHGLPGLINLYGIESPGLTAALALGDEVARRLGVG